MALAATASATSSTASSGYSTTSAVDFHCGLSLNFDLDPFGIVLVGSLFSGMNGKISAQHLAESGDRMTVVPRRLYQWVGLEGRCLFATLLLMHSVLGDLAS